MKDWISVQNETQYLEKVEKTMEEIRAACLGQNLSISVILPEHFKCRPPEEQVNQLTAQLLFALVKVTEHENVSPQHLAVCHQWLYHVLLYLLQECDEDDQTFAKLNRLLFLPRGVRYLLFSSFLNGSCKELLEDDPPSLLKELDLAILHLLKAFGLLAKIKLFQKTLEKALADISHHR